MTARYTGGCACGAVRYATDNDPVFQNHCQCRDCQKRSGTGHGSYLTFAGRAGVAVTGEARTWRVTADNGSDKLQAFCPTCGTPVYLTFPDRPDLIAISAGGLDDPALFQPEAATYGVRALAWDPLDPTLTVFERMPG